jgi:hypothetical protein
LVRSLNRKIGTDKAIDLVFSNNENVETLRTDLFLTSFASFHQTLIPRPLYEKYFCNQIEVEQYPSLQLADVYSVIAYYLRQKTEVDAYLKIRQERAVQVRQENQRRFNPIGIRDRLIARLDHLRIQIQSN